MGPASSAPQPQVINLHSAFESAIRHTTGVRIGGIVPPTTGRLAITAAPKTAAALKTAKAAAATAKCKEPNCDLAWQGSAVQHSPHVYMLLWGPKWSGKSEQATYHWLYNLYKGLGVTSRESWSTVTSQYTDMTGHPTFGSSVLVGAYTDTSAPPKTVSPDALGAEADALATKLKIKDAADAQVVVMSQPGTCFNDGFVGNCGKPDPNGTYCAWHGTSNTNLPFTNLPYDLDAGAECGENWINFGPNGIYDGFTMIAGHEYAETITDPTVGTGWIDIMDTVTEGEIADKCAWNGLAWGGNDPSGNVRLTTGTFAMQSLWSNAADRCVMTSKPGLTIHNPGTQVSTLGKAVSLQVHAYSNTDTALSFKAAGLPSGLHISTTGHVSGTPNITAGTSKTTVTVSDYAGPAKISFTWQVSSKPGAIKGYDAKCVDDSYGRTINGNKIDIWTCTGQAPQTITFTASGELQVKGKCISVPNEVLLEPCAGTAAQTWTRRANGEYVIRSSGQCLTDPNNSKANGTQLRVSACKNTADQHWSLP